MRTQSSHVSIYIYGSVHFEVATSVSPWIIYIYIYIYIAFSRHDGRSKCQRRPRARGLLNSMRSAAAAAAARVLHIYIYIYIYIILYIIYIHIHLYISTYLYPVARFSIGVAGFSIGDSWHRGGVAGFSIGCCGARPQPPLLAPAAAATRAHRWPTMIWYRCRARYEAEAP